ncbi:MAG: NGG1p interacting factor NIF3 [Candidatus Marinimicrobia bacterium]|nr:NGG1p interacting factor NIF3 [Candidatus Neomarinimicrobiota bacterium]
MSESQLLLLCFYIPNDHLESVLQAIFEAGAGMFRQYDHCAWTTQGQGRFRPLENSDPFLGKQGEDAAVNEIKVECILPEDKQTAVKKALLAAHPYEEPSYHFIRIIS